jgi:prepilin-type N-terminal cleavage/methylation domain-containing protein
MTSSNLRRPAFTLIELLVVIGLILVLATLAVAFVPRAQEKQKVVQTASQLQGWLLSARQMAMRDQAPRGLRLNNAVQFTAATGSTITSYQQVTQLSYIEQPDEWVFVSPSPNPPTASTITVTSNIYTSAYTTAQYQGGVMVMPNGTAGTPTTIDFTGGAGWSQLTTQWPVHTNDLIEFNSGGQSLVFPIKTYVQPANATTPVGLVTGPPSNTAPADPRLPSTLTCGDFRIIRKPRPKSGEAALQLPTNVVIDVPTSVSTYGSSLPTPSHAAYGVNKTGNIDILFAPSGEVISAGLPSNDLLLWLRDTSEDPPPGTKNMFGGPQYLVIVRIRTGMVAVQPVDITPNAATNPTGYLQPYSFTTDGVDSGT